MKHLKTLINILLTFSLGFGFWYLVWYFFTGEVNTILWGDFSKIFYLLFGWGTSRTLYDNFSAY